MTSLVSIVAPSYNHEKYITDSIHSIVNQTYERLELIVIDDHSKDNTASIIEELINDPVLKSRFEGRIQFIKHHENKGAHFSINEGIQLAKGDYITIINTDDIYQNNRIELILHELAKCDSQIAFSRVQTINDDNAIVIDNNWRYNELQKEIFHMPSTSFALISNNVAISTGNMFFSKELYKKVGSFRDYKYIHDWDFILRCALHCEPCFVESTSYLYRLHNTNTFKELDKDLDLCGREYFEVMGNFLKCIKRKQYSNSIFANIEVWDYFIKYIVCDEGLLNLWNMID